jgi:hypothetical protein
MSPGQLLVVVFLTFVSAVGVASEAGIAIAHEGVPRTASPALVASDGQTYAGLIAEVRRATARYLDVARARADGFVQVTGMEPEHGYHFVNARTQALAAAAGAVDLAAPPMLLYVERDGVWQLVGVEYALPAVPATSPFPAEAWSRHEASCHYRDGREVPAARAADCGSRHAETGAPLVFWHPAAAVVHVWAWYPNPDGPFARENRWLAPWQGPGPSHAHTGRSAVEVAYSQMNHRIAGAFLLVLAGLAAWAAAARGVLPRALAAPVWLVFGVYLFLTADPEAWPLGGGTLREALADPLVVQHKVLSLIPVAIAAVEALAAVGRGIRLGWLAVPVLAVAGGVGLFLHDHDGGFHLDRAFIQHAVMGTAGVAGGAVLFLMRRRAVAFGRASRLRWAWPALLLTTALVLVLYSE